MVRGRVRPLLQGVALAVGGLAVGLLLPTRLFMPLIVVGLIGATFELKRASEMKGYFKAHMEIAQIMQQTVAAPDKADSERLAELVNAIIFQAEMTARGVRVPWWQRLRRRPSRSSR